MAVEPTDEISMSEAIAAFTGAADTPADANSDDSLDEEPDVEADDGQTETELDDEDSESADDPETEEDGEPEDEDTQEDDEDDTQEAGEGRFAADDHRVKLPDGTFATVAELKSQHLMHRDYTQKTMAHSENVKAFEASREAATKRETEAAQQLEYTQALIASVMPPEPQPPNVPYTVDPVAWGEYNVAKQNYEYFAQHAASIQSQLESRKSEEKAKAEGDRNARLQTSWEQLTQAAPELKDTAKLNTLVEDIRVFGGEYGFTPQELGEVPLDARQVLVLRKAIAWDKLQAKNKAAKTENKQPAEKRPPVQKGGRRLNGSEIRNREYNASMERLNKTGRVADGVAAYLASQAKG